MRAVVYRSVGDIGLEDVPEPRIEAPTDAIVRITTTAICGTDLHLIRGTLPGMKPGTVLGHEAVGVLPELIDIVASGRMTLSPNVSHALAFDDVVGAYEAFDHRDEGWLKVALVTS
jgi:threonine dehydrogenase-like Zn-dependent dehydrogenase